MHRSDGGGGVGFSVVLVVIADELNECTRLQRFYFTYKITAKRLLPQKGKAGAQTEETFNDLQFVDVFLFSL